MSGEYIKIRIDFIEATTGALKARDYVEYRRDDYTLENIRDYLNRRTAIAEANYKTDIIARHFMVE